MCKSLSILIIEDSESDMELIIRQFQKANYDITYERVETAEQMRAAVEKLSWDLVIADYTLPEFNAPSALAIFKKSGLDIPFVVVSGAIGEETAIEIMKTGAHDYIMKGNLSRLVPAIERELKEAESRVQRKRAEEALRESETLFRKLFEDHAAVKLILDQDTGNIIDANKAAAVFYGWSREQLKQMKIQEINTLSPEEVKEEMEEVRAQKRIHFEFRHRRADGSVRDVDVFSSTIEANKRTRLHSIVYDITDRKRAEAALQASSDEVKTMSQQLWQAAKLATMGELASSIAHELNNPLATISLRVESLTAQTTGDDPRRRELEIIGQEVERMGNLVSNLLQFSRRSQPQISTVNVCDEIEKTLELVHYHLRKHNIAVAREFKPEGPLIHADRQQLRQLFLNLFTNASDAMPEGGTLTIRVTKRPEEKQICIEIADTGVGIPPEILPKVLEPFYTTKPEGKGTGLGLAICRRIAQAHNGTLNITSDGGPGNGTRVCITLPFSNGSNSACIRDE
ncbi:MAG: ATP-binding protein [Deltaproteobacteria bacterium]